MTEDRQQLGKYRILEKLGRGGFAAVYRAHDTVLKRDVALKILHPALLADPDFVTRFENDARAAAQLDHSHIVTVHDLGQLEGRLYIAMQLLPGGTLAERIKREGPLPFAEAVQVVRQVAGALDYAHGHGFVHRDVKPTNVLFNAHGEAVVTDFGLVKAAESSIVARSTGGGIVGTAAYIAPEVWEEKGAGSGTDVYALGCVFFKMLTGEPMFQGDTSPGVMMAHFRPHEYPTQWTEGVPPEVRELLEKALAQDPSDRYASAGTFAADLQTMAARTADPLAEPYKGLVTALTGERWEFALQRANEILAQDPDYRDVSALRQQAAEGQARAEQAQWAVQWKAQALTAAKAGDLRAARVAAQKWLEMAPGDGEALAQDPSDRYASAGTFAADLQTMAARTADPLAEPYKGLVTALTGERWEFALQRANEILAQDPDYRDVSALRQQAAEGQARAEQAQWAVQWKAQALTAAKAGDLRAARVAAQKWLEMAPGDGEALALQERLTRVPAPQPTTGLPPVPEARVTPSRPAVLKRKRVPVWAWGVGALLVVGGFFVLLVAAGGLLTLRSCGGQLPDVVEPTSTLTPTVASTVMPTDTPSTAPSPTHTPTGVPSPTSTATRTPIPPTNTPLPAKTTAPTPISACSLNPVASLFAAGPSGEQSVLISWSPVAGANRYSLRVTGIVGESGCWTLILDRSLFVEGTAYTIDWWTIDENKNSFPPGTHFHGVVTALEFE